ncbi:hypothetical protein [Pseudidiomarina sp.]|uniref:hypothetical protein n=1 Tax=Pseudidiomarina sp. TaxID=2081707 RepID=UPI003A9814F1
MNIQHIRDFYRQLRIQVYQEATAPLTSSGPTHIQNQDVFKTFVLDLANNANLELFQSASPEARTALWHHLWTKNRYAGIRASTATKEIRDIEPLFDNYAWFSESEWDLHAKGHHVIQAGSHVENFLNRQGPFEGKQTVGNIPKLKKIIHVARDFKSFFDNYPDRPAIDFVTRDLDQSDIWLIHQQLQKNGYVGDLTTLHFMMDVGFQVIKPDLVISRLFLDWGWLHEAADIPSDLTRADLVGEGKYGARYKYTGSRIYKPIIELSRQIVSGLDSKELENDIGWVSTNPMREFDIFVVKAGQQPEPHFGLTRRLYP